jgi:FtsZ-interacting cell division protein YlmF
MSDENKEPMQSATGQSDERMPKTKIDLFPALADRKLAPINAVRQAAPQRQGTQISIFTPISFDEALDIVESLRGRAATTVSLDSMKKIDAKRLVDFVAGASAALAGSFHKLNEQCYLFCPSNIKITPDDRNTTKTPGSQGTGTLDYLFPNNELLSWPKSQSANTW